MDKEITIYDIAKEVGLSPTTVSRALSNHPRVKENTKEKILTAAKKWDINPIFSHPVFVKKGQKV